MQNQRGYIDLGGAFLFLFIVGIVMGLILSVGLPWLWELVKPWIHSATA